jgi:hypothetical protein
MNYGYYSIVILQILNYYHNKYKSNKFNFKLTSIDPCQKTKWGNIGIDNVYNVELSEHHELIDEVNNMAFAKLILDKKKYDIIFLNGWTTFNNILTDFINVYELVKIDGYIVINNISQPGISQLIDFIINNYQFLKKLNIDNNKIAVFKKLNNTETIS